MAEWIYNTIVNVLGFTPLQLVTGRSVGRLGLVNGDVATDSLYDDEQVRKIMERHYEMMKEFREQEFTRKLKRAKNTRSKGYEDILIKEGDLVYYQHQDRKAWMGLVKVFAVKGKDVFIFANGNVRKVPRCNVQLCKSEEDEWKNEEFEDTKNRKPT